MKPTNNMRKPLMQGISVTSRTKATVELLYNGTSVESNSQLRNIVIGTVASSAVNTEKTEETRSKMLGSRRGKFVNVLIREH